MKLRELRISYRAVEGTPPGPRPSFKQPHQAAAFLHSLIGHEPVEVLGVLLLDTSHSLIAWHEVGRGTIDSVVVHPREVFKPAFLANASGVIVVHNHPSGDPTPSQADHAVLQRLRSAGELLGVELLDFIIIGDSPTRFYSYRSSVR